MGANKIAALFLLGATSSFAAHASVSVCRADAPTTTSSPSAADWQVVHTNSRGIVVRKRSGSDDERLGAFQGEGVIRGNVLNVLAVILDANEVEHWAYGITDASRAQGKGNEELLYLYSDTPWPVRDRDMVVRRDVTVLKPAESFRIRLSCAPGELAERPGVVRVQKCESTFVLTRESDDTTRVVYETQLDPAGSVPSWASRWVAKTAPQRTLEALESRASRNDGRYAAFVKRWAKAL